jgi:hypothetical protein
LSIDIGSTFLTLAIVDAVVVEDEFAPGWRHLHILGYFGLRTDNRRLDNVVVTLEMADILPSTLKIVKASFMTVS